MFQANLLLVFGFSFFVFSISKKFIILVIIIFFIFLLIFFYFIDSNKFLNVSRDEISIFEFQNVTNNVILSILSGSLWATGYTS